MIEKLRRKSKAQRIWDKISSSKGEVTRVDLNALTDDEFEKARRKFSQEQAPPYYQEHPVRICFVDDYCQFCRMWRKVIPRINTKLAYWAEPIRFVNVSKEGYRTEMDYKESKITPELFIDGIVVKGITSEAYAEGFLMEYLEDEIIVEA